MPPSTLMTAAPLTTVHCGAWTFSHVRVQTLGAAEHDMVVAPALETTPVLTWSTVNHIFIGSPAAAPVEPPEQATTPVPELGIVAVGVEYRVGQPGFVERASVPCIAENHLFVAV